MVITIISTSKCLKLIKIYWLGDVNDIDELEKFVEKISYKGFSQNVDEMFTFGGKLGDGSDSDDFAICFTSLRLLQKLNVCSNHMFHIDNTYKITKTNSPVTVLGIN